MIRKRSLARHVAMKVLFQASLVETDVTEVLAYHSEEDDLPEDVAKFARELIDGALEKTAELDAILKPYLEKWDLDRLGNVEKAILRLGAYELLHRPEIPPRVTINEAVELAKEYSSEGAGKFINGVLDRVAKEHAAGKEG